MKSSHELNHEPPCTRSMFADKIESEKSILPHIPTIGLLSRPDDDYCPCTTFCGIFVIGDWVWLWLWFFSFVLGFEYWALDNGFSVWGLVVCMSCHCSRACQQLRSVWSVFIAQLGGHSQQFPLPFSATTTTFVRIPG